MTFTTLELYRDLVRKFRKETMLSAREIADELMIDIDVVRKILWGGDRLKISSEHVK